MTTKLTEGDKAPDFNAQDQNGDAHKLEDYKGKWLALYFYPKDHTPGCIKEACAIRDNYDELQEKATIVGVSGDSVKSHARFVEKHNLPFTLLADPEKNVLDAYGANGEVYAKRSTFIINPEGKIVKIYDKVSPDVHATEMIADLEELRG